MPDERDPGGFETPSRSRQPGDAALPPFDGSEMLAAQQAATAAAQALHRHGPALMRIPGVQGFGVGRGPAGEEAIVVYLLDESSGAALPATVEGFPVLMKITGIIRAGSARD